MTSNVLSAAVGGIAVLLATMFLSPTGKCAGPVTTLPTIPSISATKPGPLPPPEAPAKPSNLKCEPNATWYQNLTNAKRAPRIDSVPTE